MPRLFPVCCEFRAGSPPDASRSTSAASSARWPRGGVTTPARLALSSPVLAQLSTSRGFWLLLPRMLSGTSSFSLPAAARPASRRGMRTPVVARPARRGVNRILAQCLRQVWAKPNMRCSEPLRAVTVAAFHVRAFSLRPASLPRSGAASAVHLRSYRASPPRSLSLGSLGVLRAVLRACPGIEASLFYRHASTPR